MPWILTQIAAIARAAPTLSLRLLGEQLQQRCVQLDNFRTHGGDSATLPALLEEMHLLLTVSGHVVADAAQGETPMVPDLICKACTVSRYSSCIIWLALACTHGTFAMQRQSA